MAYEYFDDVAFFYVFMTILGLFVVPLSVKYGYELITTYILGGSRSQAVRCKCDQCEKKFQEVEIETKNWKKQVTPCRIVYVIMLLLFLMGLAQAGRYETSSMMQYDPYKTLGIEEDATDKQIKKAYRELSRVHHPDKGGDEETFMKITKAYEMLTDETTMENMRRYGNPDGRQGQSMTIGLPTFLTKEENAMKVMFIYVLCLLILPPIGVGIWYHKSKEVAENGIKHKTMTAYYQLINPTINFNTLLEILAISYEYSDLQQATLDKEAFKALNNDMKEHKSNPLPKFKYAEKQVYVKRAVCMLYAHLLRQPIAEGLQEDYLFVLKSAHKLLEAMMEMALMKRLFQPVVDIISLTQVVTQGQHLADSPLLQLPHFDELAVIKMKKHARDIPSMRKFLLEKNAEGAQEGEEKASKSKREKVFPEWTSQQWQDVENVLDIMPVIKVECSTEVEGQQGLYEEDYVKLNANVSRLSSHKEHHESFSVHEGVNAKVPKALEELKKKQSKDREEGLGLAATEGGAAEGSGERKDEGGLGKGKELNGTGSAPAPARKLTKEELDEKIWALSKTPDYKKHGDSSQVPFVHSARLPYPKQEKWFAFLVEKTEKRASGKIVALVKVPQLIDQQKVELRFRPMKKGDYYYELHFRCDSYVGCDFVHKFKLTVKDKKDLKKGRSRQLAGPARAEGNVEFSEDEEDDDEEGFGIDDEDPDPEWVAAVLSKKLKGNERERTAAIEEFRAMTAVQRAPVLSAMKQTERDELLEELSEEEVAATEKAVAGLGPFWYYLWGSSLLEGIFNYIAVIVLWFMLRNFLETRGYWDPYVQPLLFRVSAVVMPPVEAVHSVIAPVWDPFWEYSWVAVQWMTSLLTRDLPQEIIEKKRRGEM